MNEKLKQQLTMNIGNADAMHTELQEALKAAQVAIEAAPVGTAKQAARLAYARIMGALELLECQA